MDDFFDLVQKYDGRPLLMQDPFLDQGYVIHRDFREELRYFGWEVQVKLVPLTFSTLAYFKISKDDEEYCFQMWEASSFSEFYFSWEFFLKHNG